jgi:hypothetical protein
VDANSRGLSSRTVVRTLREDSDPPRRAFCACAAQSQAPMAPLAPEGPANPVRRVPCGRVHRAQNVADRADLHQRLPNRGAPLTGSKNGAKPFSLGAKRWGGTYRGLVRVGCEIRSNFPSYSRDVRPGPGGFYRASRDTAWKLYRNRTSGIHTNRTLSELFPDRGFVGEVHAKLSAIEGQAGNRSTSGIQN